MGNEMKNRRRVAQPEGGADLAKFYGAIYAPKSTVLFTGSDFFGSVVANAVHLSALAQTTGIRVHYDTSLGATPGGGAATPVVQLRAWREP